MKLKYMVVGFIAGVVAATAITAGASTVYEKFTAVARPDYTIVVDGSAAKLNNAPVTINGSSYLPVREVATILDADVSFNSGTIEITTNKESEGDKVTEVKPSQQPIEQTSTDGLDGYIALSDVIDAGVKVTLRPSEHSPNTLVMQNGDKILTILDVYTPKTGDTLISTLLDGTEVELRFVKGSTYIPQELLIEYGIID